jgi:hypothetical protein
MLRRSLAQALVALLAAPAAALALEDPTKQGPLPGSGPAPAPAPADEGPAPEDDTGGATGAKAEIDTNVDVRGNSFEIKLVQGARISGVLPSGKRWERLDQFGEYEECEENAKGAGLRLHYVLGMEGEIFIKRLDIAEIKDLGALSDEQKRLIRDQVIAQRKKLIEEREKALREELRRMAEEQREADARAAEASGRKKAEERAVTEAEIKKGEDLLKKFSPDTWSEQRAKDILHREIVNGIFRNAEEREFIDNLPAWKAALERRKEAEAKEKGETGGETKKEAK